MNTMRECLENERVKLDGMLTELPLDDINVLLIDDEKQNLTAFKAQFRREAKVYTSDNIDEALKIVRTKKIDIIFCDYKFENGSKLNGAEILQEINKEFPNIRRVVLTGYHDSYIRDEFKEKANTTDFIYKPYNEDEILWFFIKGNLNVA